MDLVKIRTEDGVLLKAAYFRANSDKVIMIIPGINGNFIDNDFLIDICKEFNSKNYNCLCINTRGSFNVSISLHPQNLEKPRKIGAAYEVFEDCKYDIDAWLDYLRQEGFNYVDVITHCTGANKLIYYYDCNSDNVNLINNIVFLAPANIINKLRNYPDYKNMIIEAKKNVENGQPLKFVDCHIFYKSSLSLLQLVDSKNANNLPLEAGNDEQFEQLKKIKNKLSVIYGTADKYVAPHISRILDVTNPECSINLIDIEGADHLFFGKENELCIQLFYEIERRYKEKGKVRVIK